MNNFCALSKRRALGISLFVLVFFRFGLRGVSFVALLVWLSIGAANIAVAGPSAAKLNTDIADKLRFARVLPGDLAKGVKTRRWTGGAKIVVLKTMISLSKRAPGLVARANQYRPISFYYLKGRHRATARASVMGNNIELTRSFFRKGPKGRLAVLAHEISHLADSGYVISGSKNFTDRIRGLTK